MNRGPWLACAGLLALAGTRTVFAQTPPVFEASVESVYVDAFVSRNGQALPGLTAAHFSLRDNDVAQSVELVAAELRPLRCVLVFDTSSSVVGERLTALVTAGSAFVSGLRAADEAGLMTFTEEVGWLAPVRADKKDVGQALRRLAPFGATAVYDALFAALAISDDEARSVIVLFSDGEDNSSFLDARQLMTATMRSNALVHVVGWVEGTPLPPIAARGVNPAPPRATNHEYALRRIAEATGGRFWSADSPERLRRAFAEESRKRWRIAMSCDTSRGG